jgi:tetratricopeptide (TPR) repeat protein
MPAEAAADRLAGAGHLQSAGRHGEAIELARAAEAEARAAERPDLVARSLGLAGVATAKRGDFEDGLATVRSGLSLALEHELTAEAAEVYQRLGTALESAADYAGARDALDTAIGLCERSGRRIAGAGMRRVHGVRPARARRLGSGRRAGGGAGRGRGGTGHARHSRRHPRRDRGLPRQCSPCTAAARALAEHLRCASS